MEHVVDAIIIMNGMSDQNQPPRVMKIKAIKRGAQKSMMIIIIGLWMRLLGERA